MNLKRVFAGVAAAATMLGGLALGATTANAADGDQTITINNAQPGHTYTPYLIANLTYAGSTEVDGKQVPMLDVATANDNANGALKAAITAAGLTIPDTWYQENPAAWLATQNADALRKVADKLTVDNLVAAATGQSVAGEDPDSLTFSLPQGWYAITDSNGKTAIVATTINGVPAGQNVVLSKNEHGQANITTVGSVNAKSGNKLVVIEDPSKSVDMADVSAGDTVTYTVTGKIPATADNYDTFGYRLVDTPGNDLTINTTGYTVTVDGENLPEGSYTFGVDENGVATLNITNVNAATLKDFALPGKTITLTYKAQVTGTIADSNIVDNSVQAFGSFATLDNPNGTEVQSNPVTAQSFTNDFTLKKVDASGNPLTGAKFIISKTVDSGTDSETTYYGIYKDGTWSWTVTEAQATRFMDDNASEVTFNNLAAGTYTITETQVPNGFAASFAKPFQITVTRTGDEKVATSLDGSDTFGLVTLDNTNSENPVITVKNVQNVTQLPLTGAAGITMLVVVALLLGGAGALIAVRSRSLKRQLNA